MIDARTTATLGGQKVALVWEDVERVALRQAARCGPAQASDGSGKYLSPHPVLRPLEYNNFHEQVHAPRRGPRVWS